MSAFRFSINSRAEIPAAIARLQLCGEELRIPLLRAVYAGRIGMWEPERGGSRGACKRFVASCRVPAVVIIGDDDDTPSGPASWPTAQRLLAWASQVIVHGAGADPADYEGIAAAAEVVGRLLLIECCSETLDAWVGAARRYAQAAAVAIVQTPPGVAHPAPLGSERRH